MYSPPSPRRTPMRDEHAGALQRALLDVAQESYYSFAEPCDPDRFSEALAALKENLARHPGDRDTLLALISFSRDAGDVSTALEYAEQLAKIEPTDPELATLVQTLRHQSSGTEQ